MPTFRVMRDIEFVDVEADTEKEAKEKSLSLFNNDADSLIAWQTNDDDSENTANN